MKRKKTKNLFKILFVPMMFLLIMWTTHLFQFVFNISFIKLGVLPKTYIGLKGIFLSPFIHKDWSHLINNSYPILVLGTLLFYSYKKIAYRIFFLLFIFSGVLLWMIGRQSFHIGASGIIYSLASFLFFSGIIRKNPPLTAISLVVLFLYGSMIWGLFPINKFSSWEGHLSGFITGLVISILFREDGPKRKKYQWEIDEENELLSNDV
ncbi:MAG: rhomboid family intramembrane serine protease [Flavobacteriales bacterium]|nr:rhomboid family intramembrane serine protease [Flavobacteriales bacterium]MBO98643.1 rhomboid family intramembrane serine protease [Flavobacteriales bacterium]|tara:strand:- start:607 stop:1230 length:624 start_codon:yes stop_codon:yes gene_type:complete